MLQLTSKSPRCLQVMIGQLLRLWRTTRELDLGQVERELQRSVTIRLLASESDLVDRGGRVLFGDSPASVQCVLLPSEPAESSADLELLLVPGGRGLTPEEVSAVHALAARGSPVLLVVAAQHPLSAAGQTPLASIPDFPPERVAWVDWSDEAGATERMVEVIMEAAPHLRLSLARQHPALRRVVAERLVREASEANAHFALWSSLPGYVPLLGGLVGNVADLVVLTKNQVLLVFKLAGVYGRPPSAKMRLLAELLPVIGGAFLWRSLARSLVGLLPAFASVVPKAAVAFTGTYVVGELARSYYESGQRAPVARVGRLGERGGRLVRSLLARPGARSGRREHQ